MITLFPGNPAQDIPLTNIPLANRRHPGKMNPMEAEVCPEDVRFGSEPDAFEGGGKAIVNAPNTRVTIAKDAVRQVALAKAAGDRYEIRDKNTGEVLGTLKQPENSDNRIELYAGKGGFTAVVTTPAGTRYFALPGSGVNVGQTRLELDGAFIATNPTKQPHNPAPVNPQTVTPQAMILGAGLATRFEPVSGDNTGYSKPAVPLAGERSVIGHIADSLARHGFSQLFINTFYKPESLKADLSGKPVSYIDEPAPSGTAGGLRKMLQDPARYGFDPTKPVIIIQGDAVTDVDLSALMRKHVEKNALVTIGCQYVRDEDVDKFGIIVTDKSGEDGVSGNIRFFQEKPKPAEANSNLANTGFYIFSPEAYPLILDVYNAMGDAGDTELDFARHIFPEVLKRVSGQGKTFWAQKVDGYWSDIGNPAQYVECVRDIFAGKTSLPMPADPAEFYGNDIIYWPGAKRQAGREGAQLRGNVIVALPFDHDKRHRR